MLDDVKVSLTSKSFLPPQEIVGRLFLGEELRNIDLLSVREGLSSPPSSLVDDTLITCARRVVG